MKRPWRRNRADSFAGFPYCIGNPAGSPEYRRSPPYKSVCRTRFPVFGERVLVAMPKESALEKEVAFWAKYANKVVKHNICGHSGARHIRYAQMFAYGLGGKYLHEIDAGHVDDYLDELGRNSKFSGWQMGGASGWDVPLGWSCFRFATPARPTRDIPTLR